MPKKAKKVSLKNKTTRSIEAARVSRASEKQSEKEEAPEGLFDKIQYDLQHNQSYLNLILGGLIVVVLGVLIYNYFNKPESAIGPAQETQLTTDANGDVTKENLPGDYTIKAGDTLFTIAEKYYGDGYKYPEILKENNLDNENLISEGQVITIPAVETELSLSSEIPEMTPAASDSGTALTPESSPDLALTAPEAPKAPEAPAAPTPPAAMLDQTPDQGTGGAENQTIWGEKITTDTYTVQAGDWLSKISGRAYGDIYSYQKIAQANNLSNPDAIEVGMTIKIPR